MLSLKRFWGATETTRNLNYNLFHYLLMLTAAQHVKSWCFHTFKVLFCVKNGNMRSNYIYWRGQYAGCLIISTLKKPIYWGGKTIISFACLLLLDQYRKQLELILSIYFHRLLMLTMVQHVRSWCFHTFQMLFFLCVKHGLHTGCLIILTLQKPAYIQEVI